MNKLIQIFLILSFGIAFGVAHAEWKADMLWKNQGWHDDYSPSPEIPCNNLIAAVNTSGPGGPYYADSPPFEYYPGSLYANRCRYVRYVDSSPPYEIHQLSWLETKWECGDQHASANTSGICTCILPYFEKNRTCVPRIISVRGASSTMALPSVVGPIEQLITVEKSDNENLNFGVNVYVRDVGDNISYSISGVTDLAGNFKFTYVPPYFRSTSIELTVTCSACENTASKSISVVGVDAEEPQMCRP